MLRALLCVCVLWCHGVWVCLCVLRACVVVREGLRGQQHDSTALGQADPTDLSSRYTLHTAFDHPDTDPMHSPPRESIECRLLAIFPAGQASIPPERTKL